MRFDVVRAEPDSSAVPKALSEVERLTGASVTRDFELTFDRGHGMWVIDGRPFDHMRVDARPRLGTTEIWRFTNRSNMVHPIHLHLVMFQVLERDGKPPPQGDAGWKDTVRVSQGESVSVIARFADHAGRYVFHCHNLHHEDHAMMSQMEVVPGRV